MALGGLFRLPTGKEVSGKEVPGGAEDLNGPSPRERNGPLKERRKIPHGRSARTRALGRVKGRGRVAVLWSLPPARPRPPRGPCVRWGGLRVGEVTELSSGISAWASAKL